ncbi:MAG: hypothetical protein HUJ76_12970, partial [Parasporobacterium sp.]|nr:hypothetical protein [Parasporobacterium sp.]
EGKFFEINHALELTFDKIVMNCDGNPPPKGITRSDELLTVEKGGDSRETVEGVKINFGKTVSATGEYPIIKSNYSRLIYNLGNAEVNMNSGTITDCGYASTAILYMFDGKFTMNGGSIKDNNADLIEVRENGEVNIFGGIIKDNNMEGCMIVNEGGTFNMTGGSITGNSIPGYIEDAEGQMRTNLSYIISNSGTFNMTGGSISNNSAGAVINSGQFNMSGGEIKTNANPHADGDTWMPYEAGGVYNLNDGGAGGKGSVEGTVSISGNAVIKDNTKGTGENKKTSNLNVVYTDGGGSAYVYKFNVAGEMGPNAYVGVDTINNESGDVFAVTGASSGIAKAEAFKNDNNPKLTGKNGETDGELVWGEAAPDPEPPAPTPAVETDKTIPAKVKTGNRQVTISWNKVDGAA